MSVPVHAIHPDRPIAGSFLLQPQSCLTLPMAVVSDTKSPSQLSEHNLAQPDERVFNWQGNSPYQLELASKVEANSDNLSLTTYQENAWQQPLQQEQLDVDKFLTFFDQQQSRAGDVNSTADHRKTVDPKEYKTSLCVR